MAGLEIPLMAALSDVVYGRSPGNDVHLDQRFDAPAQHYLIDGGGSNNWHPMAVSTAYSDRTDLHRARVLDWLTVSKRAFLGDSECGSRIYSQWSLLCVLQVHKTAVRVGHEDVAQAARDWLAQWWWIDAFFWAPVPYRSLWLGSRSWNEGSLKEGAFELLHDLATLPEPRASRYLVPGSGYGVKQQWWAAPLCPGGPLHDELRATYRVPEVPTCYPYQARFHRVEWIKAGVARVVVWSDRSYSGSTPAVLGAVARGGDIDWLPGGFDPAGRIDPELFRWRHADHAVCWYDSVARELCYEGRIPVWESLSEYLGIPWSGRMVVWGRGLHWRGPAGAWFEAEEGVIPPGTVEPPPPVDDTLRITATDAALLRAAAAALGAESWARPAIRRHVQTVVDVAGRLR